MTSFLRAGGQGPRVVFWAVNCINFVLAVQKAVFLASWVFALLFESTALGIKTILQS